MKRWSVLVLPMFIALLTLGSPLPGFAQPDIDDSLNDNNVAVDDAIIVEDNLNDTQDGNNNANDGSLVADVDIDDSGNTDNSFNDTQDGNNNANDGSLAFDKIVVKDNGNTDNSDNLDGENNVNANDGSVAIDDINVENVGNTDNSDTLFGKNNANDGSTLLVIEDIAVASSVLVGTVSGNSITAVPIVIAAGINLETGDNCLDTPSTTGISVISQNTGLMNGIQQSVNVQANLTQ